MKKVLMVLGSVLVIFLTACNNEESPTIDYDVYEPEVYIPEVYVPAVDHGPLTMTGLLELFSEAGFTFEERDWHRNLIPITDETTFAMIALYESDQMIGFFVVYEFVNQEDFDYFKRRIGNDGISFGYPRRNFPRWGDDQWFQLDLMIINLFWSENEELDALLGEQFAGRNLVIEEVEYAQPFDPNEVSFDIALLEDFLSRFITLYFNFNPGWKNLETGQVYVRVPYGYGERLQLANELPEVIFGGEVRGSEADGWTSFTLDGSVFNQFGEPIVDAPFIFWSSRSYLPAIASRFYLYELIPSAMPFIVVRTGHWTSDTFGFPGRPRLYAYVNSNFQYVSTLRTIPSFWHDEEGNLLINYFDHYHGEYALYYLNFTDNGIEKMLITEFREPDIDLETQIMIARETLFPIPGSTELTEYMQNRMRQRFGLDN